jgi:hypothetical protein
LEDFKLHVKGEIVKFSKFKIHQTKDHENPHIRRIKGGEVMFAGMQYVQHGEGICINKLDQNGKARHDGFRSNGIIHCTTLDDIMQITEVVTRTADGNWEVLEDESLWKYFGRKPDVASAVSEDLEEKLLSLRTDTKNSSEKRAELKEAIEFLHPLLQNLEKKEVETQDQGNAAYDLASDTPAASASPAAPFAGHIVDALARTTNRWVATEDGGFRPATEDEAEEDMREGDEV